MKEDSSIEDSLEFCKEIKFYEKKDNPMEFNEENFPKLKEYIHWMNDTDETVHKDYESYEKIMKEAETTNTGKQKDYEERQLKQEEKKTSLLGAILQILGCLLISFLLVFGCTTFLATYTTVNGESMEATLNDGNIVVINRLVYRISDPKQFDVIVFHNSANVNLVKRIIGLPGQTVQIVDGLIYIDGEVVNENYGTGKMKSAGLAEEKITLGEDEYFVLGDNRNNSTDSRSSYVGLVKRKDIVGKVSFRFYPFSEFGQIE